MKVSFSLVRRGEFEFGYLAEADGNRTRLRALARTPVLKTGGPTRRPDASGPKDSDVAVGWKARGRRPQG